MIRKLAISPATALAMSFAAPAPAAAVDLIKYTDLSPQFGTSALLLGGDGSSQQWTQSVSTSNVTISAPVFGNFDWWITDAIGSQATAANVLYSGSGVGSVQIGVNFNDAATTILTGGVFEAGTYFLVFKNTGRFVTLDWAIPTRNDSLILDPAFSIGPGFNLIGPATAYASNPIQTNARVIQMSGDIAAAVPEPATWAMMVLGFALAGGAMRARRRTTVRYSFM